MNNGTPESENSATPIMPSTKPRRWLLNFFSNPLVGIIGSVASVVGVLLAIYVYKESREYPQLTYYVHPVKGSVLKAGQASKLTCNFEDKSVNSDITVAQIAIWNQGKRAIKKDNILKPVVLYTTNGAPILEATIRKQSRDVMNLELDRSELQKGRVLVSWTIAEQNDGGVIQLIYLGTSEIAIGMEGVIEGQGTPRRVDYRETIESPEQQFRSRTSGDRTFLVIVFILGAVTILGSFFMRAGPKDKVGNVLRFVIGGMGVLLIIIGVFQFWNAPIGPPFGFD